MPCRLALVLLVLAGCAEKTRPAPHAAAAVPAPDAAPAPAGASTPVTPVAPTREARRAFRQHLVSGRKLARARKWGAAVDEFEAALAAIPGDGRGLSELGWAAFQAGDLAKARRASSVAARDVIDPRIKAQVLYNLGRVEEASGKKDEAARLYQQSLALRPSTIVEERLAGLGGAAGKEDPELGDPLCARPLPADEVCACIDAFMAEFDHDPEQRQRRSCTLDAEGPVPGLRVAHSTPRGGCGESKHALVARSAAGWSVVATLEDVSNPCAFGVAQDWSLDAIAAEPLGDRRVAKIVTRASYRDADISLAEHETGSTTHLTVCVLGDAAATPPTATTCPLRLPVAAHFRREADAVDSDEEPVEHTPGLPLSGELEVRVDLAPDGTASAVLVKGSADELELRGRLGKHRLW